MINKTKAAAILLAGILGAASVQGGALPVFADTKDEESTSSVTSVGTFDTTDLDGKEYSEDIFSDYDLTMVNAFATWCTPCVEELPDLQKLSEEMKEKNVQVVGVVLDTSEAEGKELAEEALKKAKALQEKTKVTYPLLVPDKDNMNGRLENLQAFPETFFVDKDGNIVGETYSGSHSLEDWREIVEKELDALKEKK